MVTLTGPGGTGKTRLAIRIAAKLRRAFPAGAWFIDLGDLLSESGEAEVLASLVAAALGLGEGGSPLTALAEQLADRQMLLVLDNCEHHLRASAILTEVLLGRCPRPAEQEMECLRLKRAWDADDRHGTAQSLEVLAWVTAGRGGHRRAATLLGAADALGTDAGTPVTALGHIAGHHRTCERRTRAALGEATFADAFRDGRALTRTGRVAHREHPGQAGLRRPLPGGSLGAGRSGGAG
jgi:hypothetical protein